VSSINYTDDYPYDTATYTGAKTTRVTKSAPGFNGGVEVIYHLTPIVGVGGMFRYSNASVDLPDTAGTMVNVTVGGAQFGGGIRLRF